MATQVKKTKCPDYIQFDKNGDPIQNYLSLMLLSQTCLEQSQFELAEIYKAKAKKLEAQECGVPTDLQPIPGGEL